MPVKKIYREVHGCSANVADYEIASGLLKKAGFEFVDDAKKSDLNIIFTCVVKVPTFNRMIHRIIQLGKLNRPLIIAGCMPKTDSRFIERIGPKASMMGPDSIEGVVDVVNATIKGCKIVFVKDLRKPKVCLPRIRRNPVIGIIPISIGCVSNCSYCGTKFARGKLFSYPAKKIVEEAKNAINDGCKELLVTSQDNGCWGQDIGAGLPELLGEICKINGKFFIRVGMMNPLHTRRILNELVRIYHNDKIFKFLHLPVQSGSDRILKLMNRGYKIRDFLAIVKKFRKEFQKLTLSTDIIVGFPHETYRDFSKTVKLIEEVRPDIVNISKFGPRPRTEAAEMKQVDSETLSKRSKAVHKLVRKISLESNKKWVGWEGEVLVDEIGKDAFIGRNFAYKPVVVKASGNLLGKFINVKIVDNTQSCLIGKYNPRVLLKFNSFADCQQGFKATNQCF